MPKKAKEEVKGVDLSYWESLGWTITNDKEFWFAEKQFSGIPEIFQLANIESMDKLQTFMQSAEEEFTKNSDGEKGLAVVGQQEGLSVFRGEQTVDLTHEDIDETTHPDPAENSEQSENFIDAELEDSEPSKQKPPHILENLKVELSEDEQKKRNAELLQVMNTRDNLQAQFDVQKKAHQSTIKDLDRDIMRLRRTCDAGAEWRDVECEQKFDYGRGMVDLYRVDTGAYVRSRQMKESERQAGLFA